MGDLGIASVWGNGSEEKGDSEYKREILLSKEVIAWEGAGG